MERADLNGSGLRGMHRHAASDGNGRQACVSFRVDDAEAYHREWSSRVAGVEPPRAET